MSYGNPNFIPYTPRMTYTPSEKQLMADRWYSTGLRCPKCGSEIQSVGSWDDKAQGHAGRCALSSHKFTADQVNEIRYGATVD